MRLAETTDAPVIKASSLLDRAAVLLASGNTEAARDAAESALRLLQQKAAVLGVAQAGAFLARLEHHAANAEAPRCVD